MASDHCPEQCRHRSTADAENTIGQHCSRAFHGLDEHKLKIETKACWWEFEQQALSVSNE